MSRSWKVVGLLAACAAAAWFWRQQLCDEKLVDSQNWAQQMEASLAPVSSSHVYEFSEIDLKAGDQTIEGFGFFGAAGLWYKAGPYFDEEFLDLAINEMGASMFRTQIYWDGEAQNDNDDAQLINGQGFDFGEGSLNGVQLPWLKALAQREQVRVVASVWTPPLWMKDGADDSLAHFCHGQCGGTLRAELREEFAEYLVAYLKHLEESAGLSLYGLSIQNEPAFNNHFESCVYSAQAYADTLKVVEARLRKEGLDVRLFGPEHMGKAEWNRRLGFFDSLNSQRSGPLLHAYAVHGYLDGVKVDGGSAEGWRKLRKEAQSVAPRLWMSETSSDDDFTFAGAMKRMLGLHWALVDGGVSSWLYWEMGSGHIRRTPESGYQRTALAKLLQHVFASVRPGDVRVRYPASEMGLQHAIFRAPQVSGETTRVVIISQNHRSQGLRMKLPQLGHGLRLVSLLQSSQERLLASLETEKASSVLLPAQSITTWKFERSSN